MSESTTTMNLRAIRERRDAAKKHHAQPTANEAPASVREVVVTIFAFVALFVVAWLGTLLIGQL